MATWRGVEGRTGRAGALVCWSQLPFNFLEALCFLVGFGARWEEQEVALASSIYIQGSHCILATLH